MWKNTECIVAFPLQQWLRERVKCYGIRTLPVLFKKILLFYGEVFTVIRN